MTDPRNRINIGIPVEWMVDPENPAKALGVVYEFSLTRERKTVWHTSDGRPAETVIVVQGERPVLAASEPGLQSVARVPSSGYSPGNQPERHMSDIDLNELSLQELKKLQKDVTKAIASFEDRKKVQARTELEEHARQLGFSLGDFAGEAPARKRSPSVAKYRHPENAEVTWSGRGRKPKWVTDHLAKGKAMESLAI